MVYSDILSLNLTGGKQEEDETLWQNCQCLGARFRFYACRKLEPIQAVIVQLSAQYFTGFRKPHLDIVCRFLVYKSWSWEGKFDDAWFKDLRCQKMKGHKVVNEVDSHVKGGRRLVRQTTYSTRLIINSTTDAQSVRRFKSRPCQSTGLWRRVYRSLFTDVLGYRSAFSFTAMLSRDLPDQQHPFASHTTLSRLQRCDNHNCRKFEPF